ncbi:MAG: hypothetical protein OES57_11220 [Acidimicrobiia bacterium]|nr:hypothetical protein [Acidimicrobiia bacterium]
MFVVVLVVAAIACLYYGRHAWFGGDEWKFLVERDGADLGDVFGPTNLVHWTSIPIVFYRIVYNVVGIEHYWPYQILAIGLHLSAAALVRVVMVRAQVNPWLATTAAGVFAVFGTGSTNIINAFQVSFNGSLVFGLTQLLLATHPDPIRRRDVLGLAAGLVALMCSGVGVTMVAIVGLAVLLQRGWRAAALQVLPLASIYCLWWFGYARTEEADALDRGTLSQWVEFVWIGLRSTYDGLGQVRGVGVLLAVVLIVGLVVAWIDAPNWAARATRLASPVALLAGSALFLLISAFGRVAAELGAFDLVLGPEAAAASRYLHIVAALSLPAIAVGTDALSRRWRPVLPVVIVLLLVGVPGNIEDLRFPVSPTQRPRYHQVNRAMVLELARAELATQVPPDFRPYRPASAMTMGWLLRAASEGKLPELPAPDAQGLADANSLLAFVPTAPPAESCTPVENEEEGTLVAAGEQLVFDGPPETTIQVIYVAPDGTEAAPRPLRLLLASAIEAQASARLRWAADGRLDGVERCS